MLLQNWQESWAWEPLPQSSPNDDTGAPLQLGPFLAWHFFPCSILLSSLWPQPAQNLFSGSASRKPTIPPPQNCFYTTVTFTKFQINSNWDGKYHCIFCKLSNREVFIGLLGQGLFILMDRCPLLRVWDSFIAYCFLLFHYHYEAQTSFCAQNM